MNTTLTIGRLATQAGVGVETVRFYERKGLLPRPGKPRAGGFRQYPGDAPKRVRFIKRAQAAGFTLKEIQALLGLDSASGSTCLDIRGRAEVKIAEIETRMADLKRMRRSLQNLVKSCGDSKAPLSECRVIDCFEGGWKC